MAGNCPFRSRKRVKNRFTEGEEPLYSGDGIVASRDFAIGIEESGTYTITVTGDKAEGSAHFEVVSFGSK